MDSRSSGFPTLVRAGGTEKRWVGQHFVSNLRQSAALWDCLPPHACPTSLCLTPASPHPASLGLQALKPRLLYTFLSLRPSRCVSFFFIFLALHLSVVFSRSDIDFHFLSPRPLPLTAHQQLLNQAGALALTDSPSPTPTSPPG